jgi:hypothetical protein
VIPQALLSFLSIALAIQGLLCFHMNFRSDFSLFVKKVIEIFIGIVFGSIAIFMKLILLIHEHGRSFNLLLPSSISFFSDL